MKKIMAMVIAAVMVFPLAGVAFADEVSAARSSLIEDVEYKGKGVVEVDFSKYVKYKKVKVAIKDNKGKKYSSRVLKKDADDIRFRIKNYKTERTYTFAIKGVKSRNATKYGTVKGKVRINAAAPTRIEPRPVTNQNPRPTVPATSVNIEQAKAIALTDAGLGADAVVFTKAKLDYDDGRAIYEIEFYYGNIEYEYDIDAYSGAIIKKDVEAKNTGKPNRPNPGTPQTPPQNPTATITADMAKNIALTDAGLSGSQIFSEKVELDYEHGILVYEVEFKSGYYEYSYDINASDGSIVKKDVEFDD